MCVLETNRPAASLTTEAGVADVSLETRAL